MNAMKIDTKWRLIMFGLGVTVSLVALGIVILLFGSKKFLILIHSVFLNMIF